MIITTINNNKLFIKFDSLVNRGMIEVTDAKEFEKHQNIKNSDFEVIDLPAESDKIYITIDLGDQTITKTINLI